MVKLIAMGKDFFRHKMEVIRQYRLQFVNKLLNSYFC